MKYRHVEYEKWCVQLVKSLINYGQRWAMKYIARKKTGFVLMKPKFSPVRYTILTLEQPMPENRKVQRNTFKRGGSGVEPAKYPPKVKSEDVFLQL